MASFAVSKGNAICNDINNSAEESRGKWNC
jgi:hypothetical protein